ncbi:MAG: hypothetical protein M3Q45_09200, partial [Chloroflexota bacterium]|nr:hypothetical protein [Chloroflexota bacterium]
MFEKLQKMDRRTLISLAVAVVLGILVFSAIAGGIRQAGWNEGFLIGQLAGGESGEGAKTVAPYLAYRGGYGQHGWGGHGGGFLGGFFRFLLFGFLIMTAFKFFAFRRWRMHGGQPWGRHGGWHNGWQGGHGQQGPWGQPQGQPQAQPQPEQSTPSGPAQP